MTKKRSSKKTFTPLDFAARAYLPHCDQSILHSPGACNACDHYPDWQEFRIRQRINFTDMNDPDKAPCPSTYFRSAEVRDRWPGNTVRGYDG